MSDQNETGTLTVEQQRYIREADASASVYANVVNNFWHHLDLSIPTELRCRLTEMFLYSLMEEDVVG